MKTQIQIDCEVTMKAMGFEVKESKLDIEEKAIIFWTDKVVPEHVRKRVQLRITQQQTGVYEAHFEQIKIEKNQESTNQEGEK